MKAISFLTITTLALCLSQLACSGSSSDSIAHDSQHTVKTAPSPNKATNTTMTTQASPQNTVSPRPIALEIATFALG